MTTAPDPGGLGRIASPPAASAAGTPSAADPTSIGLSSVGLSSVGSSAGLVAQLVREAFRGVSAPSPLVPAPGPVGAVPGPGATAPIETPFVPQAPVPRRWEAGPAIGPSPEAASHEPANGGERAFDAAPSSGVSPILLHHGRHDSSADYYYLAQPSRRPVTSREGPPASIPEIARGAFETPALPRASVPALPAAKPVAGGAPIPSTFDVHAVRRDFPALHQEVNGHPLVWLDNAATTQKPQSVIDATSDFYGRDNSNIHRAAHTLAARSTDLFEGARDKLRDFVGAASSREIVFLRGTTEAINLVASSYGQANIGPGDEIIVTRIEHHANIVPWQLLAQRTGAVLKVAPVDERGELQLDRFAALLGPRTKFVSVTHVANALGTVVPVEAIIALAHAHGVPVLVDAAQSSPHLPIDVTALDADFLVLSGHKIFGPTGIGILYGKERHLDAMPPWQGGGHMIRRVTFEKTEYQGLPEKFEAGTPDIAGAVGLGAAVDYLGRIGLPAIAAYEHALLEYATERLSQVKGVRLIGTAPAKASVLSFVVEGFEPEQVSRHLDRRGIATRSGHHCAQPALRHFGLEQTVRASLAFYNTREDVDALIHGLERLPER